MRKIELKHDMNIPGWGILKQGEKFKVIEFNKRFIYVELGKCKLRLARKRDCNILY